MMSLMWIYQKPTPVRRQIGKNLVLLVARLAGDPAQAGLGRQHHLSADVTRVPVSGSPTLIGTRARC